MLHSTSWAKVSALGIVAAAGTILGTTAIATAQSAPVRIEKRVQVVTEDGQTPQVWVEDQDGQRKVERAIIRKKAGGQGGQGVKEARVIVRGSKGEGEGCCGCACCGGGDDDEGAKSD